MKIINERKARQADFLQVYDLPTNVMFTDDECLVKPGPNVIKLLHLSAIYSSAYNYK